MAADSSTDETDAAAAAEDKPAVVPDKPNGPPRPPRPVRRMSGALRIPLPSAITPGSKLSARVEPVALPEPARPEPARAEPAPAEPATLAPSAGAARAGAPARGSAEAPGNAAEVDETDGAAEPGNAAPRTMPSPGMPARGEKKPPPLEPEDVPTPLPPLRPSSPPVAITSPAHEGESAGNIEFSLSRRSSGAPPLSFDSKDVDPSDRAPVAPLTPWRDVPRLKEGPSSSSPPPVDAGEEDDREDTLVGQVPKDLLELASEEGGDEHTRAYQAPRELIELARRERDLRRQARAKEEQKDAKKKFSDSIPPAARVADELEDDQSDVATATVPLDSLAAEAAPPVVRTSAVRGAPIEDAGQGSQGSNAPASLEELVAAVSGPGERESIPIVSEVLSEDRSPDSLPDFSRSSRWWARGRTWAVLVGLVIVLGFALTRWGGVELPLSR